MLAPNHVPSLMVACDTEGEARRSGVTSVEIAHARRSDLGSIIRGDVDGIMVCDDVMSLGRFAVSLSRS